MVVFHRQHDAFVWERITGKSLGFQIFHLTVNRKMIENSQNGSWIFFCIITHFSDVSDSVVNYKGWNVLLNAFGHGVYFKKHSRLVICYIADILFVDLSLNIFHCIIRPHLFHVYVVAWFGWKTNVGMQNKNKKLNFQCSIVHFEGIEAFSWLVVKSE